MGGWCSNITIMCLMLVEMILIYNDFSPLKTKGKKARRTKQATTTIIDGSNACNFAHFPRS